MHPELQKIDIEIAHTRKHVRDFAIIVFPPRRHLLSAWWPVANAQTRNRCAARARTSAGGWKMHIRQDPGHRPSTYAPQRSCSISEAPPTVARLPAFYGIPVGPDLRTFSLAFEHLISCGDAGLPVAGLAHVGVWEHSHKWSCWFARLLSQCPNQAWRLVALPLVALIQKVSTNRYKMAAGSPKTRVDPFIRGCRGSHTGFSFLSLAPAQATPSTPILGDSDSG